MHCLDACTAQSIYHNSSIGTMADRGIGFRSVTEPIRIRERVPSSASGHPGLARSSCMRSILKQPFGSETDRNGLRNWHLNHTLDGYSDCLPFPVV
jgi:hypothetical protein